MTDPARPPMPADLPADLAADPSQRPARRGRRSDRHRRRALALAAGAAAVALGAGGMAYAATGAPAAGPTGSPSAAPSGAPAAGGSAAPGTGAARGTDRHPLLALARRTLHGSAVAEIAGTPTPVAFQRGTVVSVAGAELTVKSSDGYQHTWTTTAATRVRKDRARSTLGQVSAGDPVVVLQRGDSVAFVIDTAGQAPRTGTPSPQG